MNILLLESASRDIQEAYQFYNDASEFLGEYFKEIIIGDIDALQFQAGIHSVVHGYYRKITRTFPFAIYNKIKGEQVIISAVLDCRRNPKSNIDRLRSG
ncbi:MAG: hypothetical protein JJ966_05845 [Balneolaceae bacterium]|nr:hypothetical protein [Balneolaceae bacterium]